MEIKLICSCGTKYAFEVAPLNGRMPGPVGCPACGADGTAQANQVIQQNLAAAPVAGILLPSSPAPATPPGLRISQATVPAAEPPENSGAFAPPPAPPRPPGFAAAPAPKPKPANPVVRVLTAVLLLVLVVLGAWQVGRKWVRRFNAIAEVASVLGEASVDKGDPRKENLTYDDCSVLFIQHSNHQEVAEACRKYWKETLHKNLTMINKPLEVERNGEYEVVPAHNGYVRILGSFEWPVKDFEGVAAYLSQEFGGLSFEWHSEHVADTYHFGVYDHGVRKFHAQMDIKMNSDAEEIVTTEGNDFAIAHGYKPGPEGFKEFNILDADKITQRLGMKLWDEKDETEITGILMREEGVKPE
jgi:hypothetical protein